MLLGPNPLLLFDYWQWQFNGGAVDESIELSAVDDYNLVGIQQTGAYNLILNNGYCEKTTKPMNVTFDKCDCKEYKVGILSVIPDSEPYCHYKIRFHIDNPFNYPHAVSVFSEIGIFQPSSFSIPIGGGDFEIDFIPTEPFNGGSMMISFYSQDAAGNGCKDEYKLSLPASCTVARTMERMKDPSQRVFDSLLIVPNPVISKTTINYHYQQQIQGDRSIEIYSLWGYLLESHKPKDNEGSWSVGLDAYPSGQYIVVMREGGAVLLQKNLIKK